jgi:hypothetical protein
MAPKAHLRGITVKYYSPQSSNVIASSGCRIEIAYIDPVTYSSIVNHPLRKEILRALYRAALDGPVSKQGLADRLKLDYHQLVYQLNNHLRDFWTVAEERKVRGTRMELIAPSNPYTIFIALGKEQRIYVFDPLANLFGPLSKIGTRCDACTDKEAAKCMKYVERGCACGKPSSDAELSVLRANGRKQPFKPLDNAILCALKGIPSGEKCVVSIPCEGCAFLKKTIKIDGL